MIRKVLAQRVVVRTINPTWLRARRVGAGVSLREMARRLGVSAAYLSDVELGRRPVRPNGNVACAYELL